MQGSPRGEAPRIRLVLMVSDGQKQQLDDQGYLVLESAMPADLLGRLRSRILELFDEEGDRAGSEFRTEAHAHRLANLVDKGAVFREAIAFPAVLDLVKQIVGSDCKLSSLNARSADPGTDVGQPLHVDMGATADDKGYWVCNTIWLLDDFTHDNGPTRMIPGSHRWGTRPQDVLDDAHAPHPQETLLIAPAGSIVVMNAHMWHGGTANRSSAPRLAMHAFYCRRDKPQQQYQKKLLRAEVQAELSPELRQLLALDDALNDELSSTVTVKSGFLK